MTPATTPADGISQQDARFAIDGAIAYGRMGIKEPPAGHWLTEYWHIGRQLARLGETSAWDNQTPLATPSPAAVTDELGFRIKDAIAGIANCVADPMWAEHAEVSKFNLKRWHKALHDAALALATPSPGKADAEDAALQLKRAHLIMEMCLQNAVNGWAEGIDPRGQCEKIAEKLGSYLTQQRERDKQ